MGGTIEIPWWEWRQREGSTRGLGWDRIGRDGWDFCATSVNGKGYGWMGDRWGGGTNEICGCVRLVVGRLLGGIVCA